MHSALGAGIAAIQHEDIAAGAIAAPLGEMISETYGKYQKSQIQQDYKDGKISVREVSERLSNAKVSAVEVAKVGTAVAALFTGRDVNTATNAAGNAAENNFVPVLVAGAVIAMQIATVVDVATNCYEFKVAMDKGDVDGAIAAGVAVGMAAVPGQKLIPAPLRKAVHGVVTKSVTRILHSKYGQAAVKAGGELVDAASSKVQNLSKRVADSSLVKGAGKKLEDWSVSKGGKGIVQQTEKGVDLSPRVKQNHWNDVDHFTAHGQTNKVYKRDDLIDLNRVDPKGRTNAERMANNLAPIGPDNKPINLHHMIQTQDGAIAEVTQTFHKKYSKIIHINPSTTPSGIDRPFFNKWRDDYWPYRLQELKGGKQ